jgi:hypothetical protein
MLSSDMRWFELEYDQGHLENSEHADFIQDRGKSCSTDSMSGQW